uniref:Uncharacterized protein n=1 Tax=Nelumbo nucifera TaxID=4432 RepID=A0A822XU04_NELNU|nr:TPA_asm: hypothetical protein HUJ06_023768 [Nelumbo nucifera]
MTPTMANPCNHGPCNLLRQICMSWKDQNLQLILEAAPTNTFVESSLAVDHQLSIATTLQLENSSPMRFRTI